MTSLRNLPRLELLEQPTGYQQLARIGADLGHPALYVKRDDVMALGLGGNKLRALEFWLGAAQAEGCDMLLVAGAPASNQCRLVAAAAARAGLACRILYSAEAPAPGQGAEGNHWLSQLFGAEIDFLGAVDEDARRQLAAQQRDQLRAAGRKPYLIGDPVLAAAGYVLAMRELWQQSAGTLRHLVIPGSMGPTEAGVLYGLLEAGFRGQLHVISVEYAAAEMQARIEAVFNALQARIGAVGDPGRIAHYNDEYLGGGYGVLSAAAAEAIKRFGRSEALLLEPTYSAKPFAALLDLVQRGVIAPDQPACVLHTGGVPSLFESGPMAQIRSHLAL